MPKLWREKARQSLPEGYVYQPPKQTPMFITGTTAPAKPYQFPPWVIDMVKGPWERQTDALRQMQQDAEQ